MRAKEDCYEKFFSRNLPSVTKCGLILFVSVILPWWQIPKNEVYLPPFSLICHLSLVFFFNLSAIYCRFLLIFPSFQVQNSLPFRSSQV